MTEPDLAVRLIPWEEVGAAEHLDYELRNRGFLAPWQTIRPESRYTLAGQEQRVLELAAARQDDREHAYVIQLGTVGVSGALFLSGVNRGPFQNAYLGYSVDGRECGRGIATAAVRLALGIAFGELGLHRVEAGVMPRNAASVRVLEKCAFQRIGLSPRHLQIAGEWEDHIVFARTSGAGAE